MLPSPSRQNGPALAGPSMPSGRRSITASAAMPEGRRGCRAHGVDVRARFIRDSEPRIAGTVPRGTPHAAAGDRGPVAVWLPFVVGSPLGVNRNRPAGRSVRRCAKQALSSRFLASRSTIVRATVSRPPANLANAILKSLSDMQSWCARPKTSSPRSRFENGQDRAYIIPNNKTVLPDRRFMRYFCLKYKFLMI